MAALVCNLQGTQRPDIGHREQTTIALGEAANRDSPGWENALPEEDNQNSTRILNPMSSSSRAPAVSACACMKILIITLCMQSLIRLLINSKNPWHIRTTWRECLACICILRVSLTDAAKIWANPFMMSVKTWAVAETVRPERLER
jgi:hypothetical protein